MVVALLALIVTSVAATGVALLFTSRASSPAELDAWARSYGLALTARNRPAVTYYVRLVIVTRVVGAVSGAVLGSAFDAALGLRTSTAPGWWAWLIGGWTFGAWWAERELRWPPGAGVAALLPRRVADYLPGRLRAAPHVALGIVVALAAIGALAPTVEPRLSRSYLLAMVAVAGVVAGLTQLTVGRIVSRRQPALEPDQMAADDAIRTSAAHQLAGGGTAVVLCLAAALASTMAGSPTPSGRWGGELAIGSIVLWLAAIVSWRYYTYRAWRVRRQASTSGAVLVAT